MYRLGTNSGQHGTVYPSSMQIEIIHGQISKKTALHPTGLRIPIALILDKTLLFFCTWHHLKTRKSGQKTKTESTRHTANKRKTCTNPFTAKVTVSSSPAWVKLLVLPAARYDHPLLLPAHRQSRKFLASGDLYCSCFRCFKVHPDICLK